MRDADQKFFDLIPQYNTDYYELPVHVRESIVKIGMRHHNREDALQAAGAMANLTGVRYVLIEFTEKKQVAVHRHGDYYAEWRGSGLSVEDATK